MDKIDNAVFVAATAIVIAALIFGLFIGNAIGKAEVANDVCVTLGYDKGIYTHGEIVCGYDYVAPDELAPYFTPDSSGVYWSEEASAL